MELIKDFRRKQGNLEFFFLSLVRADSKEKINFLIEYGRTLQIGGKDCAGVDEIDLEAEIADNSDRLQVVMLQVRGDLKSPAKIDLFKLPNIKRMLDSGVANGREVSLLQGVCDSLISIMENNKTLFKLLIKKYTKQDETDTGDNEPQQYTEELIKLFNGHKDFIDKLKGKDKDLIVPLLYKWCENTHTDGKPICQRPMKYGNQTGYARGLFESKIIPWENEGEAGHNKDIRNLQQKIRNEG